MSQLISCRLCGATIHSVQLHLDKEHPGVTLEKYRVDYPDAPIFSQAALDRLEARRLAAQAVAPITLHHAATANVVTPINTPHVQHRVSNKPLHEVFGLAAGKGTLNSRGDPIPVSVFAPSPSTVNYLAAVDDQHVWNPEDLKNELMAIEMGWPLLVYGHKGTGKSSDIDQIAARCRRPIIRVQHTANTEEAHILGQWTITNGSTEFQLGLLGEAMLKGMIYLADEYDVASPGVCAVYQPVLEGKPLVIKDAPPHLRVIRPAPGFTFVATGNTNGTGDASGLYPGTTIQNSANYDRFVIKLKKGYMPAALEANAIVRQTGIEKKEAEKLVKLATEIRTMFESGKLSDTISTRALVSIARVGLMRATMRTGIQLCYANGLNEVDYQAVDGVAQRMYG